MTVRRTAASSGPTPCRDDPNLWFSDDPADIERAKAGCHWCPVQPDCLAGAMDRREPYGVWGGELIERGRILARKRRRGRPPKSAVVA